MAGLLGSLKGGCPGRSYVLKTLRKKFNSVFIAIFGSITISRRTDGTRMTMYFVR